MGQTNWGIPYMGSKSKIAPEIINFLPKGKRLVDLFGGGFAITECAMYSKKWDSFLYNDINPLITDLIKRAINGDFNYDKFKPEFITREKFFELKDKDGYVKYIWSFSNQGDTYLFGKPIEKIKEQGHNYCLYDQPIDGLDIPIIKGTPYQKRMYLKKWSALKFEKEWKRATPRLKSDYKKYCAIIDGSSKAGKELALKFTTWLRSTGITAKEIKELTNSDMASHYLTTASQPAIPTDEMWQLLKKSPKLKNVPPDIELMCNSKEKIKQLIKLEQLQRLQQLERLQQLQQLQQLERLQQLEQLQQLEITTMSYEQYVYQDGDVVYCDIPYENTAEYDKENGFNHKAFYEWAISRPYKVYFSSYKISDNRFKKCFAINKRSLMAGSKTNLYNFEMIYSN
jgi:site-specific DNA-adenine methylase